MLDKNISIINISLRAYASMLCELEEYPDVETGGVLLGYFSKGCWNVIEATDPGKNAVRKLAEIQCDMEYLQHTVNVLNRIYDPPLEQIGVWHKHNHSYNPPFSTTDTELHMKLAVSKEFDIISILFQKADEDDEYSMHAFICDKSGETKEAEFQIADLSASISYEYT